MRRAHDRVTTAMESDGGDVIVKIGPLYKRNKSGV